MSNLFPDIAETPSGQSSLSSVPTVTEEYQVPFGVEPRSGPYRNFILFASGKDIIDWPFTPIEY